MPDTQDKRDPLTPDTIRAVRLSMNRRWLGRLYQEFAAMDTIALDDLQRLTDNLKELGVPMKILVHATCDSAGSAQRSSEQLIAWCTTQPGDSVSRECLEVVLSQGTRRHLVLRFLAVAAARLLT